MKLLDILQLNFRHEEIKVIYTTLTTCIEKVRTRIIAVEKLKIF